MFTGIDPAGYLGHEILCQYPFKREATILASMQKCHHCDLVTLNCNLRMHCDLNDSHCRNWQVLYLLLQKTSLALITFEAIVV
uniref:Uncharacterized protein n=1 Tax=Rhipicephalus appendiculatus TaxID=34631 RepID=A0A131YC24_RHIAP